MKNNHKATSYFSSVFGIGVMRRLTMTFFVAIVCHANLLFACGAEIELQTVQAKGFGSGRQEAIQAALIEAVSKASGITLDVSTATSLATVERYNGKQSIFQSQEDYNSKIREITKGVVSSWAVINESNGTQYAVELSVTVARVIGAREHAARKTLAVMTFRVNQAGNIASNRVPVSTLSQGYRESLISYLTSSRKFSLVDETFKHETDAMAANRAENNDAIQNVLDKANQMGADYLAMGIGESFNIENEILTVGSTTAIIRKCQGLVRLRVIHISSRQTVLAADFRLDTLSGVNLDGSHPEAAVFDTLGKVMSYRILDTIYPIRISSVTEQLEVVLDRGGESIKTGDQFGVYSLGNKLTDDVTGESLGYEETLVSAIEITRVLPKVSYAKVLNAKSTIEPEYICRRLESQPTKQNKADKMASPVDDLFK